MTKRTILVLLLASVAGACDAPTQPTPVRTPSTPTPTSGPDEWATDLYPLINATRRAGLTCEDGGTYHPPTHALRRDARLEEAARTHALDLVTTGVLDWPQDSYHTGSNGSSLGDRVQSAGYRFGAGETIAWWSDQDLQGTPAAFALWVDSAPDCELMMNPRWADVGVGFAQANGYTAAVANYGSGTVVSGQG